MAKKTKATTKKAAGKGLTMEEVVDDMLGKKAPAKPCACTTTDGPEATYKALRTLARKHRQGQIDMDERGYLLGVNAFLKSEGVDHDSSSIRMAARELDSLRRVRGWVKYDA